jgi:hypothetical protein
MVNWGSHRTLRLMNSGETSWLLPCPKGPRKIASLNFVKDKKWQSSNICKLLVGGERMEKGFLVGSSSEWSPKLRVKRCQKKVRWSWSKTYPSIKLAKSIHMASEQIIKLSSPWQSALAWSWAVREEWGGEMKQRRIERGGKGRTQKSLKRHWKPKIWTLRLST